jgi:hypothetical protein
MCEHHRKPLLFGAAIVAVVSVVVFLIFGPFTKEDFVGDREVGAWFADHTPHNATFLTMGPALGNLVSSYGDRGFFALSVSEDPKLRDPAYVPITNPDSEIRHMHVQYAVWDAYTADQTPFFSQRLMSYIQKYSGTPVYSVWVDGNNVDTGRVAPPGAEVRIVVYQLVGGAPLRDQQESLGP